jgi:hypothetical protein
MMGRVIERRLVEVGVIVDARARGWYEMLANEVRGRIWLTFVDCLTKTNAASFDWMERAKS